MRLLLALSMAGVGILALLLAWLTSRAWRAVRSSRGRLRPRVIAIHG